MRLLSKENKNDRCLPRCLQPPGELWNLPNRRETGKEQGKGTAPRCVPPRRDQYEFCPSSFYPDFGPTVVQPAHSVSSRGGARKASKTKLLLYTKAKNASPLPEKQALGRVISGVNPQWKRVKQRLEYCWGFTLENCRGNLHSDQPQYVLLSEIRIGNFMLGHVQKEGKKVKRGGDGTRQLITAHCGNRISTSKHCREPKEKKRSSRDI